MRRVLFSSVIALLLSSIVQAQTPKPVETIPVSEIHAGMEGVAYTVFQGTKPESMGVEVLGILKNANGPKGDIILVRLSGEKAEYTGVVAGMSGSPGLSEWQTGRSAGLPHRRIFQGTDRRRDPHRGDVRDQRPGSQPGKQHEERRSLRFIRPPEPQAPELRVWRSKDYANYLKPIEAPLVFSGFSQEAMQRFAPQFAKVGNRAGHGRGLGQRKQAARTFGTRLGHQCDPGAWRHGHRRHLHRHLHGCAPPAGLRASRCCNLAWWICP